MKAQLIKLTQAIQDLRDNATDDELCDELDNAILHLELASDRLVAMEEDEDDLLPYERDAAIAFADELLEALS